MTTFYLYIIQCSPITHSILPYTVRTRRLGVKVILTMTVWLQLQHSNNLDIDSKNTANVSMIVWPLDSLDTGTGLSAMVATLATLSPPTVWL